MSGWSTKLPLQLDEVAAVFRITGIRNPDFLDSARQTGFVWTAQPGVVCLAMNRKYIGLARDNPDVVTIIIPPSLAGGGDIAGKALVVCEKADQLYHYLHMTQLAESDESGVVADDEAIIDVSAELRGHVRVEAGARIGPRVVIDGPARIARDARIDAGAIVGCDGLYVKSVDGVRQHVRHFGGVIIDERAHIHAGAVISRSAISGEATHIGKDAHVGILSNIGHDVQVGEAATISSNVVIAGRATIGARAWIGASVNVSNMVTVGNDAEVRIGAVVIQDVPPGGDVSGNFALAHGRNMKRYLRDCRDGS